MSQGGSNGNASGGTAKVPFVGTAIGGALGSGAFFATATPTLAVAGSTLAGNQSQGGTNVVVAGFLTDHGSGRGGAVGVAAGNGAVSQSTVSGNTAKGGALFIIVKSGSPIDEFGSPVFGGGIDYEFDLGFAPPPAAPSLTLTASTSSGNVAQGTGPTDAAEGGGFTTGQVNVQMSNSTVSGNQALGTPGGGFSVRNGVHFEDAVQEIFAVQVLPQVRFHDLINDGPKILSDSFVLPYDALNQLPDSLRGTVVGEGDQALPGQE